MYQPEYSLTSACADPFSLSSPSPQTCLALQPGTLVQLQSPSINLWNLNIKFSHHCIPVFKDCKFWTLVANRRCSNLWFPLKTEGGTETVVHKCPRHLNLNFMWVVIYEFVPIQRDTYHLLKLRLVPLQALGILQKSRVGMVHLYISQSHEWQNVGIKDEFKTWRSNLIVWSKTLSRVITSSLGSCGRNASFINPSQWLISLWIVS